MSDELKDMAGRKKPQIAEPTTGVCKPDDYDKWLKPLYLGLTNGPGVYSASSASGGDSMCVFLRFEGDKVKQATFRTAGSAACSLCCFFAAKLTIEKLSDELGKITGETIMEFMGGSPRKRSPQCIPCRRNTGEGSPQLPMKQRTEKQRTMPNSYLTLVKPARAQGSEKWTVYSGKIQEDCG